MKSYKKLGLVLLCISIISIFIMPIILAKSEYSLFIKKNEELVVCWQYNSVNQSLIKNLENDEEFSSSLFLHNNGDLVQYNIIINDDVERSWCTGHSYYWEILIDEYNVSNYSNYITSHKYRIHKLPEDYAREMLISTNYFTELIIPQEVESFLEELELCLKDSNKSDNYSFDENSICINMRDENENKTAFSQSLTYNDDGLLEEHLIFYDNQIAARMQLIKYYKYDLDITPIILWLTIIICLLIGCIIAQLGVAGYNKHQRKNKDVTKLKQINEWKFFAGLFLITIFSVCCMIFELMFYEIFFFIIMTFPFWLCPLVGVLIFLSYKNSEEYNRRKMTATRNNNKKIHNKSIKTPLILLPKSGLTNQSSQSSKLQNKENPSNSSNKSCSKCAMTLATDALFCHKCGKSKNTEVRFCQYCGTYKIEDSNFCYKCGNLVDSQIQIFTRRNNDASGKLEFNIPLKRKNDKIIEDIYCSYCGNKFNS